jgi:2-(1,2-epoxy-1,2-dihydrophenyl)acetyl-CoA isomerase
MTPPTIVELVHAVYRALAAGDRDALARLLHPDFEGTLTESLPFGIGGVHRGADAMIRDAWWAIGREFGLRAKPTQCIECTDGRLLVLGRYTGRAGSTDIPLDAVFAHLWTGREGRLAAVWQLTDSAAWWQALGVPDPQSSAPSAPSLEGG